MTDSGITEQYLESFLKDPIEKFEVRPGSNLGDGYTCALYSVDVWKKSDPESPLSLLIKCFPSNANRQELLDQGGSFKTELQTYTKIIPELIKFQEEMGVEVIPLPVPQLIYGQYIPPNERKNSEKPFNPLDNCIIMQDLRKKSNGAFRLRDRFLGLDLDHYKLVLEAQATLHALSWAYKCKRRVLDLETEFPFLKVDFTPMAKVMKAFIETGFAEAKETLKEYPEAVAAAENLYHVSHSVDGLYWGFHNGQKQRGHTKDNILRNPGPAVENEEPWEVLLHGDAWSNNMMFRYDQKTNKPVEVVLLDFQMCRQGDPFCDINHTLYTSGTRALRHKHLTSMLHVYYDTFSDICEKSSVETFGL